ncbi:hypothetical protein BDR07DRAFT_1428355 [Suillus spraguei]|nr:hypothetical protein BDR07DRAFT_1428355 [Suillus spraguei]
MWKSLAVWVSYCQEGTLGHGDHCFPPNSATRNFTRQPQLSCHEFPYISRSVSRSSYLHYGIWKVGRRLEQYPAGVCVVGRGVVVSIVEGHGIRGCLSHTKSSVFPEEEARASTRMVGGNPAILRNIPV